MTQRRNKQLSLRALVEKCFRSVHHFLSRRLRSALLFALLILFVARPVLGESRSQAYLYGILLVVIVLLAIFSVHTERADGAHKEAISWRQAKLTFLFGLASVALLGRLLLSIKPGHLLYLIDSAAWCLLLATISVSQVRSMLRQMEVTSETLAMSLSTYLLIGLTWSILYLIIHAIQPNSFDFRSVKRAGSALALGAQSEITTLLYFSLTSLCTIGFGDVLPNSNIARYAAVGEGITGQFYLAVLVARLVGIHLSSQLPRHVD